MAALMRFEFPLLITPKKRKPLKFAVITDIHYGLAPDADYRMDAYIEAVQQRKNIDVLLQLGDFCYSDQGSEAFLKKYQQHKHPTLHVLGNHDMDKCTKDEAVAKIGLPAPYYSKEIGDYNFVVLDLNHFKKNGELTSYANGNYFTDNATHNWADPKQIEWLMRTIEKSKKPIILLSHQPLGFSEPGQSLPEEQQQVLDVITKAGKANPKGAVALILFGHLHVDRLEHHEGIPCYCVNSASYFWSGGMCAYSKPLFAFMEITPEGKLIVEGVGGEFIKRPPADSDKVLGRSASISNRTENVKLSH
jgi:predicted phosphodiesterase